jgi:myo-inositol 2-dehydrogenase/D-chiro-inositol 1-dehydrogenase
MGVHEFDQTRFLTGQEFETITAHASGIAAEPWPGDPESAQAIAQLSGGTSAIVSLGRRFPLGDVCKVEVFGTKDAQEARFLWPPSADETFYTALRVQAESFARHVGGAEREGAGGEDAAAAIDASGRAAASIK